MTTSDLNRKTLWVRARNFEALHSNCFVSARLLAYITVNFSPHLDYALCLHDRLHSLIGKKFFQPNQLRYYAVIY